MKKKTNGKVTVVVVAVLAVLAAKFGLPIVIEEKPETVRQTREVSGDYDLEVHYIDVGQGDATLITCGDHAMLIDAGNNNKGTAMQSYLQAQGIESLDYVIGTHPDADHIGGLDVVLYKFDCDQVFMPDVTHDTKTFEEVIDVIADKDIPLTAPTAGSVYTLGEADFTVIAPVSYDYGSDNNNYSIGILLEYGDTRFIFTGDAGEESEADMLAAGMDVQADVYKTGHHGSSSSSSQAFLEAVDPVYAVISCGEDNSYGHPHAEVLNRLRQMGVQVFRTDEQGTVVAKSNGNDIVWNMGPDESWKAGENR